MPALPPVASLPVCTAVSTRCIPSLLAVMHRRMILSCLLLSMPSVARLHLHVVDYGSLYPYYEIQLAHLVSRASPA